VDAFRGTIVDDILNAPGVGPGVVVNPAETLAGYFKYFRKPVCAQLAPGAFRGIDKYFTRHCLDF